MGLHVYCIVPRGHAVPGDTVALEGAAPFEIAAGDLALWATEHDEPVAPSIDTLRTHNDVVLAGMTRRVTPVPIRYGQWFATREIAADLLAGDAPGWSALLVRFAGRAEYGVRVMQQVRDAERDVRTEAAETGKAYMAALAQRHALSVARREAGERISTAVAAHIGSLAADERVEYAGAGDVLVNMTHLVAWSEADAYHAAVLEVLERWPDTRFALSGPWPPWTFVE